MVDAAKHKEWAPGWRCRVDPRFRKGTQPGPYRAQLVGNFQKATGRTGEAVKPCHLHHITSPQVIEHPAQLGPVTLRPAGFFLKQTHAIFYHP